MVFFTACGSSNTPVTDNKAEQTAISNDATKEPTVTPTVTPKEEPAEKGQFSNNSSSYSSSGKCQFKYSDGSVCGRSTNKYNGLCDEHFNQLNDTYNDLIGY